jgi:dolichol-phosphate mannosyltransferase
MFSLVIPTHNNKPVIKPLLNKLTEDLNGLNYEIIVVDDDSPDNTAVEVLNFNAVNPRVRLVVRRKKKGFSTAVIDGFNKARGGIVGVMPPTLFSDTSVINEMIKGVDDYDLVIGCSNKGFFNRLTNRFSSFLAKKFLGLHINDPLSDFFILDKSVFKKLSDCLNPDALKLVLELCARDRDLKFTEIVFDGHSGRFSFGKYLKQLVSLRGCSL